MSDYNPLFPDDCDRTQQFRRVIIRKTLQAVRENPGLDDEALLKLAEQDTQQVCDLCIESSFEDQPKRLLGQYFLTDKRSQRKDHVGRFFLHPLEAHLKNGSIRKALYPVFARSVPSLLGEHVYNDYQTQIETLIKKSQKDGILYDDIMNSDASQELMRKIVLRYREEMQKSTAFQDRLINQIDDALTRYQTEAPNKTIDIDSFVQDVFRDFAQALLLVE